MACEIFLFLIRVCVKSCYTEQQKNRAYFSLCIRVRRSRDSCSFLATCQRNSSTVPFLGNFNSKVDPVVAFTSTVMISSILLLSFFLFSSFLYFSLFFYFTGWSFSKNGSCVCALPVSLVSSKEMWNTNHVARSLALCIRWGGERERRAPSLLPKRLSTRPELPDLTSYTPRKRVKKKGQSSTLGLMPT